MKRTLAAIAAVLLIVGIGVIATGGTASAGSSAQAHRSALPKVGHYEGRDSHHRHIRFYYGSHGQVINFRVEHTAFPPAHVQGDKWHHTCHNNHCTRGHWINDTTVNGHWNISTHSGGDVGFSARWISH